MKRPPHTPNVNICIKTILRKYIHFTATWNVNEFKSSFNHSLLHFSRFIHTPEYKERRSLDHSLTTWSHDTMSVRVPTVSRAKSLEHLILGSHQNLHFIEAIYIVKLASNDYKQQKTVTMRIHNVMIEPVWESKTRFTPDHVINGQANERIKIELWLGIRISVQRKHISTTCCHAIVVVLLHLHRIDNILLLCVCHSRVN